MTDEISNAGIEAWLRSRASEALTGNAEVRSRKAVDAWRAVDRDIASQARVEERRNWAQRVEVLQEQLRVSEERYMALLEQVASGAAFRTPRGSP